MLKALYGPAATAENDWAFSYLPKIDRNYSWVNIWNDMYEGKDRGRDTAYAVPPARTRTGAH
jgi:formate dehydrogenase major subunit